MRCRLAAGFILVALGPSRAASSGSRICCPPAPPEPHAGCMRRPARMPERVMLEAIGVSHFFDVSRPLLQRLAAREPRRWLRAVDDVSFKIQAGATMALVGESGCGKSTIARLVVGLHAA